MVQGPDGFFVVPVYFGEHPRGMIVDTGAEVNMLFRSAVIDEGLHETGEHQYAVVTNGFTGSQRTGIVNVPLMKFAGIPLKDVTMSVTGVDAPKFDLLPVAGWLGTPYLSAFDVEMDVPGERLSLYSRSNCAEVAPPWQGAYSRIALRALSTNLKRRSQDVASSANITEAASSEANQARLFADVQINGRTERALLDTGATTTVPPELAEQLGLAPPADAKRVTIRGVDGGQADGDIRRASELRIGDLVLHDKPVGVFPIRNAGADMVLGREAFRGQRVWISFAQKAMFVQPSDSKP